MQVLTAQYPTLYTRKFRFRYTDFTPFAVNFKALPIVFLARTIDVFWVKLWPSAMWTGPGVTSANFRIHDNHSVQAADSSLGQYSAISGNNAAANFHGASASVLQRMVNTPVNGYTIFNDMVAPTQMFLTLKLNALIPMTVLTAGVLDVWLVTAKNP